MVRVKKRYLLLEVVPDEGLGAKSLLFDEGDLIVAVREAVLATHGDFGLGSVINSLYCKRFSPKTGCCLLSCRRGPHYLLLTSLPFVKIVKNTPCTLRLIHLSGTIRGSCSILKRFLEHQIAYISEQGRDVRPETVAF